MIILWWTIIAFLAGSIPFSVWLGRLALRTDIRRYGDHNPGATNVARAGGWQLGTLVLILDMLKGALPVGLAWYWGGLSDWALIPVALAPLFGHAYSPFLGFRGGKALAVLGYLPLPLVHHTPWTAFAAANGQCMVFRWRAYESVGGHKVVHSEVLEDVILARRLKAKELRLRMADGANRINCRMYPDWPAVRDGYAKNILAGYGGRVSVLLLATLFHWLIFLLPWVWLGFGWLLPGLPGWPLWPLLLAGLGIGIHALTAAVTRQQILDALLMTRIAFQAIWWQWRYGGPLWKGRVIKRIHAPV